MDDFNYCGKQVTFWQVRGEVLDTERYNEMRVRSSGIHHRSLRVTQTKHHDFWIREDDGSEVPIQLEDVNVALRAGQRVTLVYAKRHEDKRGWICSLINHSTNQTHEISSVRKMERRLRLERITGKTFVFAVVAFTAVVFLTKPPSEYFAYPWRMVEWNWAFAAAGAVLICGAWRKSRRSDRAARAFEVRLNEIVSDIQKQ